MEQSMGRPKKSSSKVSKPRRSSKPHKAPKTPRKTSDAARTRKIARELEKAQHTQEASAARAAELREQMAALRGRCPHRKLKIEDETGNVVCCNCFAVVGVAPTENSD
jgi:hypothetical protein